MKLSEEEFSKLVDSATDSMLKSPLPVDYLMNALVTDPLDYTYVHEHNEVLTDKYQPLVDYFGYEDFESLYLASQADFATYDGMVYSRNNEAEKSASKNKDVSKLKLVQRTVMRRGKPTTLSFYEDPNKGAKTPSKNDPSAGSDDNQAQDFTGFYIAGDELGKPDKYVANTLAHPGDNWYVVGNYRPTLYDYMFFVQGTDIVTVAGIAKTKGLLTLAYVATPDEDSYPVGLYRSLKKLLKLAYESEQGITYKPYTGEEDICQILFDYFDIKKSRGVYTDKKLSKKLGDLLWKKK